MNLPFDILNATETLKGGPGSGNWGHQGLEGVWGGSSPTKEMKIVDFDKVGEKNYRDYIKSVIEKVAPPDVPSDPRNHDTRSAMKNHIVTTISEQTGLSYSVTNDFVKQWSETSNKTRNSYQMQKVVSEEFDIPLSNWQKERFRFYEFLENEHEKILEEFLTEYLDTFSKEDYSKERSEEIVNRFSNEKAKMAKEKYGADIKIYATPINGESYLSFSVINQNIYSDDFDSGKINLDGHFGFNLVTKVPIGNIWELDGLKWYLDKENNYRPDKASGKLSDLKWRNKKIREERVKFAKQVYENTQEALKKAFPGMTHISLYRGVKGLNEETAKKYNTNVIESWSARKSIAGIFTTGSNILSVTVPMSKIFSSALSGMGCLSEYEFLLLGGEYEYKLSERGYSDML